MGQGTHSVCTLQAFEQFGTLYIHNLDDNYLTRPGIQSIISELRATTGQYEPLWAAINPKSPYRHEGCVPL